MISIVWRVLYKLVAPLWRTVEMDDIYSDQMLGGESIRSVNGCVTQLCLDYGIIDHTIYFTSEVVLGGVMLREGDLVSCVAVRNGAESGWVALRVEKSIDTWEAAGDAAQDAETLRPLIGMITSFNGIQGCINQTTFFKCHSVCEGFLPMKGDWVQAKYAVSPNEWTTQVHSVSPLRYCRRDRVHITSICSTGGVVEDSIFFSFNSVLMPANYEPLPGHLVNVVILESNQSLYHWRALCMAPCSHSENISMAPASEVNLQKIFENKERLEVSEFSQFGELMMGETAELVFWIQNKGTCVQTLESCDFAGWDSKGQFALVSIKQHRRPTQGNCTESSAKRNGYVKREQGEGDAAEPTEAVPSREVDVKPGERLSVTVSCQAKTLGCCAELLLLHFSSFTIGRRLEVTVGSKEVQLLQPSVAYSPTVYQAPPAATRVSTVTAPKRPQNRSFKRQMPCFLPLYPLPQLLRDCMDGQGDPLLIFPCLGEVLSPENMLQRFSALLWLEELHAEMEVKGYTIFGALLQKGPEYLQLEIPGLAEGRPSVNMGDKILLKKQHGDGEVTEYHSYVVGISGENVSLRVNAEFHRRYLGEPLDVEFWYNRIPTRRCHNALNATKECFENFFPSELALKPAQWTEKWLDELEEDEASADDEVAPAEAGKASSVSMDMESKATQTKDGSVRVLPKGRFFNRKLNPVQKEAVKMILAGQCRPTPYVLFGPPGTGKTVTLIEAILQVYHFLPGSRILVCTPSNSAADLICIRLHHSGFLHTASLARIYASSRTEESIPEVLSLYSKAGEDVRQASYHRIVISTCSSSGMFYNIGLQVGHFTHVFLDEAGQATEPESLIPISFVSETEGQIVLAGDPCQLGPIVKSKQAGCYGLGVSLLERLMSNPLYSRGDSGYNPKLVTKLTYNYRSHEALLQLPSKLFYHSELICKAPRTLVESLCQWKGLPRKGFPLLFHGVRGQQMREGTNPSWFNPVEAVQIMMYCCKLTKQFYKPLKAADIGIIAPYRKQCEKIRLLLGKVGLSDIKVGSVEEFQGQEFLVIMLSTVRSSSSLAVEDLQGTLGFLSEPKRFNVAITRPKALLIVVGNPHVLIMDPCFKAFLLHCFSNGAYVGCNPPLCLSSSSSSPTPAQKRGKNTKL